LNKKKLNHVNKDKTLTVEKSFSFKRNTIINKDLSNSSSNSCINNSSILIDDTMTKSNLIESFYLTAPRASPELSDLGDMNLISNNILIEKEADQIEPVQNSINLSSITKSIMITSVSSNSNDTLLNVSNRSQKRKTDVSVNFDNTDIEEEDEDDIERNDRQSSETESEIDIESLANNIHKKKKRKKFKKNKTRGKINRNREYVCCIFLNKCREAVKKFVNTKLFVRGILGAILINTLSMGVEHHEQPGKNVFKLSLIHIMTSFIIKWKLSNKIIYNLEELTMIVEYSNMLFTTIFFIEMLLKLFGEGLLDYIKNAYNVFDGVIVGLR
jgi:hypothetical protein